MTEAMHRVGVIFHFPSTSWQDSLIQILIPGKFKRPHLHVSFSLDDDYYTYTCRGLEVLDPQKMEMESMYWLYVNDLEPFYERAFERCEQKVSLWSLAQARLGYKTNTCASLVSEVIFDKYVVYPDEVMQQINSSHNNWF